MMAFLITSCSDTPVADTTASQPVAATTVYKVMTEPTYPPFVFRDQQDRPSGFDVDILNAIAQQQGFSLTYTSHPWQSIFNTLDQGQADIVSAGITITEARKERMDFSAPYFESRQMALLGAGAANSQSFADLKPMRLALKPGTTSDDMAKQQGLTEKATYENTTFLTIRKVMSGEADATIGDSGVMLYYQQAYPDAKLKTLTDNNLPPEEYGFVVRKGNTELQNKLNQGLQAIKSNGTYDRIYRQYFAKS
ncbi:basic amino acid ABC transporter substrate-binding protein [Paralysiella testudinis]|uniref:Basic amino acid ABC transporter substrate-binding protein n=1 Tax=Paralysiella testudinis TaxID=2809020 RepID=A0A892ZEL4_9NEIS|nr:basic amino acid ABC transporter substrate-binding protein [Paralysiella testudinis]QRQ81050.1 basic amino acid ABC transporter substrate-binding protein [Paralysiella testudinis]